MMRIEDALENQFDQWALKISKNDRPKYVLHFYADFIELISLFSNSVVSDSDIFDRFKDEGIINYNSNSEQTEEENNDRDRARSEKVDKYWQEIYDAFEVIHERKLIFDGLYPFKYSYREGSHYIHLKDNLTIEEKIYLNLLICSNLDSFKILKAFLTNDFEVISKNALFNLLPNYSGIMSLGKISDIKGTAYDKILELSKYLHVSINEKYVNRNDIKGTQEKGLDLVIWRQFDDLLPNYIIILVQCTCEKDWVRKVGDTAPYEDYYHFYKARPIHSLFVPYALIDTTRSKFYQHSDIKSKEVLIIERKRLLELLRASDLNFYDQLPSKKIVEECISHQERIY